MKKMCGFTLLILLYGLSSAGAETENAGAGGPRDLQTAAFGVYVPTTKFYRDFATLESGSGIGARFGVFGGDVIGLEFSAFQTRHDDPSGENWDFSGMTVDLKLRLPLAGKQVVPYGSVGAGRYVIRDDEGIVVYRGNVDWNGINGTQVGLGIDVYLSEQLSVNAGFARRRIEFDYGTSTGADMIALTKTIDFGLNVHW